jgi:hypothetical protein
VAELESKIATYEAAIQANRDFLAREEKLQRENQALRLLLDLSGADPMVVEQHIGERHREGTSEEMNLRSLVATNSGSFGAEMPTESTTLQLSNVGLSCFYSLCERERLDSVLNSRG